MKNTHLKYWIFILCCSVQPTIAADRTARLYEIGAANGAPIYTQKIHTEALASGETAASVTVYDSKGSVILAEKSTYRGTALISQTYDQFQTNKKLDLKVEEGWAHFKTQKLDQPKNFDDDQEKVQPNFITGPVSELFLLEHLPELMDGKTVPCRFGVLELRESVGFKFKMKEKTKIQDREVVVVEMTPSSFIIKLIVDPIYLYLDPKAKKLVKFQGRTPLWKTVDGKLKPLDAEIFYD